jgi:hypothetical protein
MDINRPKWLLVTRGKGCNLYTTLIVPLWIKIKYTGKENRK